MSKHRYLCVGGPRDKEELEIPDKWGPVISVLLPASNEPVSFDKGLPILKHRQTFHYQRARRCLGLSDTGEGLMIQRILVPMYNQSD